MKEHYSKLAALSVLVLVGSGCSHNDQPTARQHKPHWKSVDNQSAVSAKEAPPPKILPDTHFAAGRLFERQGLAEKAIQQYRKAIAVNHNYGDAHHRLGVLLSATGRHEEALPLLRRAATLKPGSAVIHNDLGFELLFHHAWVEAEQEFRRATQILPRYPRAYVNLGLALSQQGRFDDALAAFLEVLPEPDAHYNLALLLRGQQRYAEATESLHTVLRLDPNFRAAHLQLEQITPRLEQARAVGPMQETAPVTPPLPAVVQGAPQPLIASVDQAPATVAVTTNAPLAPSVSASQEELLNICPAEVMPVMTAVSWLDESWVGPVSLVLPSEPPCFDDNEVIVERRELIGAPIGYNTYMQPVPPDESGSVVSSGASWRPTAAASIVDEPLAGPPTPTHSHSNGMAPSSGQDVSRSPQASNHGASDVRVPADAKRSTLASSVAPSGGGSFMSPVARPMHRTVFAGEFDNAWDGAAFAPSVATNPRAWLRTIDDYHDALSVVRNEIACWEEKVQQQVWFEEVGLNYSPTSGY